MQSTIRKIAATCVLADALLVRPAAAQQSTEDLAAAASASKMRLYVLQPLARENASLQAFHYVARPNAGPDWAVRFQFQFLFPK